MTTRFLVAPTLLASIFVIASGAQASVIYLPATDELKFVSDGEPGVYVEYGVGKTYLLWNDEKAKNLSQGSDNSGSSDTWSLWDEHWGPIGRKFVDDFRRWRELSIDEQRKRVQQSQRTKWDKDMFSTANSPKRYPLRNSKPGQTAQEHSEPMRDANGCLPGQQFYEYKGFLGIGREKLGCMTPAEAAALHHQRGQAWRNINTQQQLNQMQYQQQQLQFQQRQQQFQQQQQQYRTNQQLYYLQQQINRPRYGF